MFYNCKKLKSLDLSNFEANSITNVKSMFCQCSGLRELKLTKFDLRNAFDLDDMFKGLKDLKLHFMCKKSS